MAKVEIVAHRSHIDATLASIQRSGVVQLLDATSVVGLMVAPLSVDASYVREAEQLRHLRTRLSALIGLGPPPPPAGTGAFSRDDFAALWAELEELAPLVEPLVARIDTMVAELATLPRRIASLRRLLPLVPEVPGLVGYETLALLVERRHAAVIGMLSKELSELLNAQFEIISEQLDPDTVGAVVVFPRTNSPEVHGLLAEKQVSRVQLPDEFQGMSLSGAIAAMEARLTDLPGELAKARDELGLLLGPREHWNDARAYIDRRLGQLDALRKVGTTERAFAAVGWVPRRHLDLLVETIREDVGAGVVVSELDIDPDEPVPVLLTNKGPVRPFQLFLGMLSLPRYGTFDPTVLMALFMPFFFGLMLGDVAYGLILGGLALWARRRWGERSSVADDLTRILAMGSAWAVVWGVVFGEVFGDLGHRLFELEPLWINREEAIEPLLLLAVGIGAAHILLGLALGMWTAARAGDRKTFGERTALLVALAGLFTIAGVAADRLPTGLMTPSIAVVVVATVVMMGLQWPLGIMMGPLDLVGAVTNVLSYLRLAAIGLASVFLARVANELGTTGPVAMGIVIGALFHAMNLALGAFSPTIQSLRLHYVEFFDKFYEPGGEPFQPFGDADVTVAAEAATPVPIEV